MSYVITKNGFIAQVNKIAEPMLKSEGMELVHVEYRQESKGKVLRLYMDKPGGVTLDDCVYISRHLGDLLDVELESNIPYSLEVSSPGPDRPLSKEKDFQRFKGNMASIKTEEPIDGQKNFKGILKGVSEGSVKLMINDKTIAFPYHMIKKARLVNYIGDKRC